MNIKIRHLSYYQSLYSDSNSIPQIIQEFLKHEHGGKDNPIQRKGLHSFVKLFDPEVSDRNMRRYYEMLDKCWCRGGLFYPTIKEVRQEIDKITGTIIHFAEKKRLLEKLEDKLKKEPIQMRLY